MHIVENHIQDIITQCARRKTQEPEIRVVNMTGFTGYTISFLSRMRIFVQTYDPTAVDGKIRIFKCLYENPGRYHKMVSGLKELFDGTIDQKSLEYCVSLAIDNILQENPPR